MEGVGGGLVLGDEVGDGEFVVLFGIDLAVLFDDLGEVAALEDAPGDAVVEGHDVPDVADEELALGEDVADAAGVHEGEVGAGGLDHGLLEEGADFGFGELAFGGGEGVVDDFGDFVFPEFDEGGDVFGGFGGVGVDEDGLPGEGGDGLGVGIDFEFEAAELFAVAADADEDVVRGGLRVVHAVVEVAGDDDGDVGFSEEGFFLFGADVGEDDDEVGLGAELGDVAADGFDDGGGVPLAEEGGGGEEAEVIGHGADDADAEAVDFEDEPGVGGEGVVLGVDDVGGDHGVLRHFDEVAGLLPAVVEVVVAEGEGVEAEEVGDFEDGGGFVDGGDGGALGEVAGVEEDAVGAVFALLADDGGEVGEAAVVVGEGGEAGVEVVGVEDGEGADFGGEQKGRELEDGEEGEADSGAQAHGLF